MWTKRAMEFSAFRARASIGWAIRNNDVPALGADQMIVAGSHDFESVSLDTIRAAHLVHEGILGEP